MSDLDAYQLEQRALTELARGQTDRALKTYVQILRKDPRDRRIRQKLAELYEKGGHKKEAEKQFRQLVKAYRVDGNHRAALVVLQRVLEYQKDDGEMWGYLGETYRNLGRMKEAKKPLEKAWQLLQRKDVKLGLSFATMRLEVDPDDMPYLIQLAEDLESMNMGRRAFGFYMKAIQSYKLRGATEEMGRLAVRALQISPGQTELLRVAAEASLAVDDLDKALEYLQRAREERPEDVKVLQLLAECLEQAERRTEAASTWREMATQGRLQRLAEAWVTALEALAERGEEVESELLKARASLARQEFRLTDLEAVQPTDEASLRCAVRSEVYARYGFGARVVPELDQIIFAKRFPISVAWRSEIAWDLGDKEEARRKGLEVLELLAEDDPQRGLCLYRLKTMGCAVSVPDDEDEILDEDEDDELIDDELIDDEDDDELIDDEDTADSPTAPPGRMAPAPRAAKPPSKPPEALNPFAAPMDDDPFGDVFESGEGTFAEVDPDELDDPFAGLSLDDEPDHSAAIEDAQGLIGMGLFADAIQTLKDVPGLEAATLRARCIRETQDPRAALMALRDAVDEADEDDPQLLEAWFEMADLAARAGKIKLSLRTLKQVHDRDRSFRAKEVAARVRLLRKRL